MKALLKVVLLLLAVFAATFVVIRFFDLITIADIRHWLTVAHEISPLHMVLIVVLLLFVDLFISVPTMAVSILAGYFLGMAAGALAAVAGMALAGLTGYGISRLLGERLLGLLVREPNERQQVAEAFERHGFTMIIFSRSMPMLPEASACLAGMTRMQFPWFLLAWAIATVPYALIAAYAGSASSLEDPKPALYAALGIQAVLWSGWMIVRTTSGRRSITEKAGENA